MHTIQSRGTVKVGKSISVTLASLGVSALVLSACNGGRWDGAPPRSTDAAAPGASSAGNSRELFDERAAQHMGFCRTCHIPEGVADTDEGRRFLLSSNSGDDYENTYAAWQLMGEGVESNPLIVENADDNEPHSGGKNWPVGSDAYKDMVAMLSCWDDPAQCGFDASARAGNDQPLLDSDPMASWSHVEAFCEGGNQPDEAQIPPDPREQVQPGINEGKAVAFNLYWVDCHQNIEVKRSSTCGQYRERKARGLTQATQAPHDGLFGDNFSGAHVEQDVFNGLWRVWGLPGRPNDFDERLIERYGFIRSRERNPYPLPDEDPKLTDGGSGQLPLSLAQVRDANGDYTGAVTFTCASCHSGEFGQGADDPGGMLGAAPSTMDIGIFVSDMASARRSILPGGIVPPNILGVSKRRGNTDAVQLSVVLLSTIDNDTNLFTNPVPRMNLLVPGAGTVKPIHWWNMNHRVRHFYDGAQAATNHRMGVVAFPVGGNMTGGRPPDQQLNLYAVNGDEKYAEPVADLIASVKPPQFPGPVNTRLAEAGAVLFHSKNLWADGDLDDIPQPQTNGSCAGCHGVYSPRYAHDPTFLDDPSLKGITGYLAPVEVIGTSPERTVNFLDETRRRLDASYIGYPDNLPGWVHPDEKSAAQEAIDDYALDQRVVGVCTWEKEVGYNTPNLYGVWAAGPYLHNGSVPDMWTLLKPEERPELWRRKLVDVGAGPERGFDTSLDAYDFDRLGWKYDPVECTPARCSQPDLAQITYFSATIGQPTSLLPMERERIEERKIFNSYQYAAGHQGHDYGRALNDAERRAIIEYLKTL